jgi:hypothetical protein
MQAPRPQLNPNTNVLHQINKGYLEALEPTDPRYCYAIPTIYPLDGFYVTDCWLVDRDGNVDPGYNVSPVPIRIENLTLAEETADDDRDFVVRGYSS